QCLSQSPQPVRRTDDYCDGGSFIGEENVEIASIALRSPLGMNGNRLGGSPSFQGALNSPQAAGDALRLPLAAFCGGAFYCAPMVKNFGNVSDMAGDLRRAKCEVIILCAIEF